MCYLNLAWNANKTNILGFLQCFDQVGGEEEGTLADTSNLSIDCDMEDASKVDLDMDQTSWKISAQKCFVSQLLKCSPFFDMKDAFSKVELGKISEYLFKSCHGGI